MPAVNFPIVHVIDEVADLLDQRGAGDLALELDGANPINYNTAPQINPTNPACEAPIGGTFDVPVEMMIKMLNAHLQMEYAAWHLYKLSAQLALGPFADVVAEEFKAHAGEEEGHIDIISRKIVMLGGIPVGFQQPADWVPPQDVTQAIEMNYKAELDAIASLNGLISVCGANEAMAKELQDIVAKEAEHAEDLKRMRMYDTTGLIQTHPVVTVENPSYELPIIPFPSAVAGFNARQLSTAALTKALREAEVTRDTVTAEAIEAELKVRASQDIDPSLDTEAKKLANEIAKAVKATGWKSTRVDTDEYFSGGFSWDVWLFQKNDTWLYISVPIQKTSLIHVIVSDSGKIKQQKKFKTNQITQAVEYAVELAKALKGA